MRAGAPADGAQAAEAEEEGQTAVKPIAEMSQIELDRHFKHPDSEFYVEFPPGPLSLGGELPAATNEIELPTGKLELLSPTDCVKDRLAAYYHWKDRQGLEQAALVAEEKDIDLDEIERW